MCVLIAQAEIISISIDNNQYVSIIIDADQYVLKTIDMFWNYRKQPISILIN